MLYILFFITGSIGLYSLSTLLLRIPPGRAKKNLKSMSIGRSSALKQLSDFVLTPILPKIAKLIPLSPRYELDLSSKLIRAGIPYSAREYYARAGVWSFVFLTILLFGSIVHSPLIQVPGVILPILIFRKYTIEHTDILKKRKKRMSRDIPHFIRSVLYRLGERQENDTIQVDIIQVFEDYIKIAPESLSDDLKLLVTEMKSRSVELGLRNFADRLGLPEIRQMVSAVIGIYHGQNQTTALLTLSREVDTMAREHQQRELNKQPGRIKLATIPIMAVAIITLLYVLIMHVYLTSNGIF